MLVKFEQKSYSPNYTKFGAFWQKIGFSKTIFDKTCERRSCSLNNSLMLSYYFEDYRLSVFQKLR